jgi:hypothetical protein
VLRFMPLLVSLGGHDAARIHGRDERLAARQFAVALCLTRRALSLLGATGSAASSSAHPSAGSAPGGAGAGAGADEL